MSKHNGIVQYVCTCGAGFYTEEPYHEHKRWCVDPVHSSQVFVMDIQKPTKNLEPACTCFANTVCEIHEGNAW